MALAIRDTRPIISGDYRVVGAALKIVVAGGSALDTESLKRASGMSPWVWQRLAPAIKKTVKLLEREG